MPDKRFPAPPTVPPAPVEFKPKPVEPAKRHFATVEYVNGNKQVYELTQRGGYVLDGEWLLLYCVDGLRLRPAHLVYEVLVGEKE